MRAHFVHQLAWVIAVLSGTLAGVSAPASAETWLSDKVLGQRGPYPFAGIYEFDNLTVGDDVEVTSSGVSQLAIRVTGTLTLGRNATIRVRNGYYSGAPGNPVSAITAENRNRLGIDAGGFRVYPDTFGRGGDGGDGGGSPADWPGAGGGGGYGGGDGGAGGSYEAPGSDGDPGQPNGGAGGGPGGPGGGATGLGGVGKGGGNGGGGNGGNGMDGAWHYTNSSGGGGGGGGSGGGILTVVAGHVAFDPSGPPHFIVSGQRGGSRGEGLNGDYYGTPGEAGDNGEGGLLIIDCPDYLPDPSTYALGATTFGQHVQPSTNGGHGVVTGNPQRVLFSAGLPDLLIRKFSEPDAFYGLDNVYQAAPSGDQVESSVGAPGGVLQYSVRVQNDRTVVSSYVLKATETRHTGWTVDYKVGAASIRNSVTSPAGYTVASISPRSYRTIVVEMRPGPGVAAGGSKIATLSAFLPGSNTVRDSVRAIGTCFTRQPDLLLKNVGDPDTSYASDNIYQTAPVREQVVTQAVTPGKRAIYLLRVQNDGPAAGSFVLKAGAAPSGWTTLYRFGATDISEQITNSAGYATRSVAPGSTLTIGVWVGSSAAARAGTSRSITVRAYLGAADTTVRDAVMMATTIVADRPSRLVFARRPAAGTAGVAFAPAVQVAVRDALGNTVPTASNAISLSLSGGPAGATLTGTKTVSPTNGVATFANLSIDKAGSGYRLTATAAGLVPATTGTFAIQAGSPARLAFGVQPASTTVGAAITPAVVVQVQDRCGNVVPGAAHGVTLALSTNPSAGVLSGTRTVAAVNGAASFAGLSINKAGAGYVLRATAAGLTAAYSKPFQVLAQADAFEPDDTSAQAKTILRGARQNRTLHLSGDVDWAVFTLGQPADVRVQTTGAIGDTQLWLYGPGSSSAEVAYSDDRPAGSALAMVECLGSQSLAAGTYFIRVAGKQGGAATPAYTLSLATAAAGQMGDAYEPDDTPAQAKSIAANTRQRHSVHLPGDADWVKFTLAETSYVRIDTDGWSGDTEMWLHGPNNAATLVEYNDNGVSSAPFSRIERIQGAALPPGIYYLKVQAKGTDAVIGSYELTLQAVPAALAPDAYEADDTAQQARGFALEQPQAHSIHAAGDVDWVAFTLSETTPVRITAGGLTGDTEMWLYGPDSAASEIAYNDNADDETFFSRIERSGAEALPPGTYYVKVQAKGVGACSRYFLLVHALGPYEGIYFGSDDGPPAAFVVLAVDAASKMTVCIDYSDGRTLEGTGAVAADGTLSGTINDVTTGSLAPLSGTINVIGGSIEGAGGTGTVSTTNGTSCSFVQWNETKRRLMPWAGPRKGIYWNAGSSSGPIDACISPYGEITGSISGWLWNGGGVPLRGQMQDNGSFGSLIGDGGADQNSIALYEGAGQGSWQSGLHGITTANGTWTWSQVRGRGTLKMRQNCYDLCNGGGGVRD